MKNLKELDAKIQISKNADDVLMEFVGKVNDGFNGGRVGRGEAASWIIMKLVSGGGLDRIIEEIRRDHFDEVTYLQHVVSEMKASKRTGEGKDALSLADLLKPLSASSKISKTTSSSPDLAKTKPKP